MFLNNTEQPGMNGVTIGTTIPTLVKAFALPTSTLSCSIRSAKIGPVGVLITPFTTIEKARDLGGLLITNHDGTWWFAVGADLEDCIARGKVNMHAIAMAGRPFMVKAGKSSGFKSSNWGADRGFELTDFEARPRLEYGQVVTGACNMYAIVTGAHAGFGSKTAITGRWSYMNTVRNMDEPIESYLRDVRPIVVAAAPSDIREYVDDSFEPAMSTWVHRHKIGSIGCASAWLDGVPSATIPSAKRSVYEVSTAASASDLSLVGMAASLCGDLTFAIGPLSTRQEMWSGVNVFDAGRVISGFTDGPKDITDTAGITSWMASFKPKLTVQRSALYYQDSGLNGYEAESIYVGFVNARLGTAPAQVVAVADLQLPNGRSRGYDFTALRIGHALGKQFESVNSFTPVGTVASLTTGLADHMVVSYDVESERGEIRVGDSTATWAREYELDRAVKHNVSRTNVTPYDRGTFRELSIMFSVHWDDAAEKLARERN